MLSIKNKIKLKDYDEKRINIKYKNMYKIRNINK